MMMQNRTDSDFHHHHDDYHYHHRSGDHLDGNDNKYYDEYRFRLDHDHLSTSAYVQSYPGQACRTS